MIVFHRSFPNSRSDLHFAMTERVQPRQKYSPSSALLIIEKQISLLHCANNKSRATRPRTIERCPSVDEPSGASFCPARRAKSKLVFDLMAMRNYASAHTACACAANWPGQAGSGGYISIIRGNYYERPSSSILIFCSRPLRPRQRLNSALCSPWR